MVLLVLAEKDWDDIKFGVENQVDFYAVSFVKDAQVVHELKNYLQGNYVHFGGFQPHPTKARIIFCHYLFSSDLLPLYWQAVVLIYMLL